VKQVVVAGPREHNGSVEQTRIGWFTSWNSKCGIAEYSKFLLNSFDNKRCQLTILASCDDILVRSDDDHVIRCWTSSSGHIAPLLKVLESKRFDAVVIQFNFSLLSLKQLGAIVVCCHSIGTKLFVVFHGTEAAKDEPIDLLSDIIAGLATVDGILVHSTQDVEQLQNLGLSGKVGLFPHGHIEIAPINRRAARQDLKQALVQKKLQLPDDALIIGSYGFLLPHKGIDNLILAVASLRASGMPARLLLVNALYPHPTSSEYLARCQSLVAESGIVEHVIFESDFLPNEISLTRLAACDILVFPYGNTVESSSAAVRMGLASRRPVLCSPQPIFADVADAVVFLDGDSPEDIAQGIHALLSDNDGLAQLADRQEEWLARHSWSQVARRLQDIVEKPIVRASEMERNQATMRFVAALVAEREASEEGVKLFRDQYDSLNAQLATVQQQAAAAAQREQELAVTKVRLERDLIEARERAAAAQLHAAGLEARANMAENQVASLTNSTSWRLTRPMRSIVHRSRRLFHYPPLSLLRRITSRRSSV